MATVTFQTPQGPVTVTYRLAAGVATAKAFVAAHRFGTWSGDMGNAAHQWNNGDPAQGRRHGDHTAWSSDGPAGVVKAFDWKPEPPPPGRIAFRPWLVAQLRAGRYRGVCKFVNIDNRQYAGSDGRDQGYSDDTHLHWSCLASAVNSGVNPIEDYYREVEDDMYEAEDRQRDINTNGRVAVVYPISAGINRLEAAVEVLLKHAGEEAVRDAADAVRDAELLAAVKAVDPGDEDALRDLLERIRVTVAPGPVT